MLFLNPALYQSNMIYDITNKQNDQARGMKPHIITYNLSCTCVLNSVAA